MSSLHLMSFAVFIASCSLVVVAVPLRTCQEFCDCMATSNNDITVCNGFFDGSRCDQCQHDIGKGEPLSDADFELAAKYAAEGRYIKEKATTHFEANTELFQGDMIGMTEEKMREIEKDRQLLKLFTEPDQLVDGVFSSEANLPREVQYAAQRDERYKWPNAIVPYELSSYYNKDQRAVIAMAMRHIEARTCVRFVQYTPSVHDDYISIWPASAATCASAVGRQFNYGGGQQSVMLGAWCLWSMGTAIHELMHALGFFHEQSRADRDDYVTIRWENIPDRLEYNFQKYDLNQIQHLGVPYDYESIMHYSSTAFGINGAQTIEPKQPGVELGQREFMSDYDMEKVNRLYQCQGAGTTYTGTPEVTATTTTPQPICEDTYRYCYLESAQFWCNNHPGSQWNLWMLEMCQKTCGQCE